MAPEPPKPTLPAPVVEDLLLSEGYTQAQAPIIWLRKSMVVSKEVIQRTAVATTGQRDNTVWSVMRKLRITASNFGVVLRAATRNRFAIIF